MKKWKNMEMGLMGRPEEAMGGGAEVVAVFGGWPEVKRWWCMEEKRAEMGKGECMVLLRNEGEKGKVT
jgi:hypothetical protein